MNEYTNINVLERDLEPILFSTLDKIGADRFKDKIGLQWKGQLQLTEGLGDWTVFIFANGVIDKNARDKEIGRLANAKFEVGLKMFDLKVKKD